MEHKLKSMKQTKTMKKIPYGLLSIFFGVNVICRSWLPHWILFGAILFCTATGLFYAVGVLRHNTAFFHTYIGWTWMLLPLAFAHAYWINPFCEWNSITLFLFGLCVSLCMVGFWVKDEQTEADKIGFFQICAAVLLAMAVAFFPMGINESVVTDYEFQTVKISSKEVFTADTSLFVSDAYLITLEQPNGELDGFCGGISQGYWNTLQIGDEVPVCAYTGLLGKKFYSFFMDAAKAEDYCGLNDWSNKNYAEVENNAGV